MSRRRAGAGRRNAFGASGWLLAEVALVLMVIFQGSQAPQPVVPTDEEGGSSTIADPPVEPPVGPPSERACRPPGLSRKAVELPGVVVRGPDDVVAAQILARRIAASPDRRPGLILLFGVSYSSATPNAGEEVSEDLARLLQRTRMGRTYRPAVRTFLKVWSPGRRTGTVYADVYYLVPGDPCGPR